MTGNSAAHHGRRITVLACAVLAVVMLLTSSCAIFRKTPSARNEHELMREAVDAFNRRDYKTAITAFQAIKDQYPFSPYVILAELKIADSHFNREEYPEAIYAYDDFIKLHPQNEAVPYALYQMGMCYFNQMRPIDRDQDITRKAVAEFQRLIRSYPESPFRVRAENRLAVCLQNLAGHEMYVGRFYYKGGHYLAAKTRFEGVIRNFPDLGQYNEALRHIKMSEERLQRQQGKKAAAATPEAEKLPERKERLEPVRAD